LNLQTEDTFRKTLRQILSELALLKKNPLDIGLETTYRNELPKLPKNISDQESKIT